MRMLRQIPRFACALPMLLLSLPAMAMGAVEKGGWTLERSEAPEMVQLSLKASDEEHGRGFDSSSSWAKADLVGLDWATAAKHDVHFTVTRDAGTLDCDGFVQEGAGAGLFTFKPNPRYAEEMAKLGFTGVNEERPFAFLVHDVSLEFARQIRAEHIADVDAGKLLAFRIHGVSRQFIEDMRSAGVTGSDADQLIAFRIHGVSPEFVKSLRAAGISADNENLIAFRIHGVSPEFVNSLQAAGVRTKDSEALIAFRIHGVSPEFVRDLGQLGYAQPDPEQLVALRIHGVTPQYIEALRTRGLKNLTLEKIISLRIQGID